MQQLTLANQSNKSLYNSVWTEWFHPSGRWFAASTRLSVQGQLSTPGSPLILMKGIDPSKALQPANKNMLHTGKCQFHPEQDETPANLSGVQLFKLIFLFQY